MSRERSRSRRGAYIAGAATVAVAAVAVIVLTAGGHSAARAGSVSATGTLPTPGSSSALVGAGSTSATGTPTRPVGPVNTDPDYTPSVLGAPGSSDADSAKAYVVPYAENLPESWQPASWYAKVSQQLGTSMRTSTYPVLSGYTQSGGTSANWEVKIPGGSGDLTVDDVVLKSGQVASLQCFAQNFDASSSAGRTAVLDAMKLCADADFPGNASAQADAWVSKQTSGLLTDLTTMSAGERVRCSTPVFGTGIYWLIANKSAAGASVQLMVYGAETAPKQ